MEALVVGALVVGALVVGALVVGPTFLLPANGFAAPLGAVLFFPASMELRKAGRSEAPSATATVLDRMRTPG